MVSASVVMIMITVSVIGTDGKLSPLTCVQPPPWEKNSNTKVDKCTSPDAQGMLPDEDSDEVSQGMLPDEDFDEVSYLLQVRSSISIEHRSTDVTSNSGWDTWAKA